MDSKRKAAVLDAVPDHTSKSNDGAGFLKKLEAIENEVKQEGFDPDGCMFKLQSYIASLKLWNDCTNGFILQYYKMKEVLPERDSNKKPKGPVE